MKYHIIILPGWGGSTETWKEFGTLLKEHLEVHIIDLPCFGTEPCPEEVWGVEEYASFVAKKIKKLDLAREKTILLGHSFGGQVGAYLSAHHKNLYHKLILSGAAVVRKKRSVKKTLFKVLAVAGKFIFSMPILWRAKSVARKVLYKAADSPDYAKTSGVQREIFKKVIAQDMTRELENIDIPTLVIWGTEDSYTPLSEGKQIAKAIPNATLQIIKGGKHGLHLTSQKELLRHIRTFIGI